MARTIQQLKTVLANANTAPNDVRQAALELAEHMEQLTNQFNQMWTAYQTHGHPFFTTDTNGQQMAAAQGEALAFPNKQLSTCLGFGHNVAVGAAIKLGRPIKA